METITIPSPTALLNSPILATPSVQRTKPKNAKTKKNQSSPPKTKAAVPDIKSTTKPKQSKSRNGMDSRLTFLLNIMEMEWADTASRLRDLQSKEIEM